MHELLLAIKPSIQTYSRLGVLSFQLRREQVAVLSLPLERVLCYIKTGKKEWGGWESNVHQRNK